MAEKEKLNNMVDNLIGNKPEQAEVDFHDYLQTKMREIVGGQGEADAEQMDNEE